MPEVPLLINDSRVIQADVLHVGNTWYVKINTDFLSLVKFFLFLSKYFGQHINKYNLSLFLFDTLFVLTKFIVLESI